MNKIKHFNKVRCKRCGRFYHSYMTTPSQICERPDCIPHLKRLEEGRKSDKRLYSNK